MTTNKLTREFRCVICDQVITNACGICGQESPGLDIEKCADCHQFARTSSSEEGVLEDEGCAR